MQKQKISNKVKNSSVPKESTLVLLDTKFLDTNVPNGEDIKFLDTNIPNAEEKTAIKLTNDKCQQKSIATKVLFFFVLILTLNNLTFKLNTV